jgi:hypothetical protein
MAAKKKAEKDELEKCGECKNVVANSEKAVQCELCNLWFHCRCEEIHEDSYKILKQDKVHFYCGRCDKSVGRILKTVLDLKKRQDKLHDDFETHKEEVEITIKDFVSTFMEEAKTKTEKVDSLDKSIAEMKKEIVKIKQEQNSELQKLNEEVKDIKRAQEEISYEKQIEQLTQAFVKDTPWSDMVKKEVDSKIENVSAELNSIQKIVDITKGMAEEEKDKEARSKNIIMYNLPESSDSLFEVRQKHDKSLAMNVFRELIDKNFEETEIQKIFRLGKMGADPNKPRPLLVQFVDKMTKNYLMHNLYHIRKTPFKDLAISHDMTLKEREQCKQMVEEAKNKEQQDKSGEWKFRVRGLPGQMRVVKLKIKK